MTHDVEVPVADGGRRAVPARVAPGSAGLWFALVSAAAFGSSGTLAKGLLDAGWSPGAAVLARVTGGALVLGLPAALALRGRWRQLRQDAGLVLGYGLVAVAGCQLAYFTAVTTLSVGVALLLEYLAPVLLVAWLWARHGRRPRRWTLVGIASSLAGLVLVLDVTGGVRLDLTGVLWALTAACALAVYYALSGREGSGLPPVVLAGGGSVVAAVTLGAAGLLGVLPMTATTGDVDLAGHRVSWLVPVAGLALVSAALAYAAGVAGTRRLGSTVASFVGLTEVLFAVLLAWLLLGELPLPVQLLGGVLVVAGAVAVHAGEAGAGGPAGAGAAAGPAGAAAEPGPARPVGTPEPLPRG